MGTSYFSYLSTTELSRCRVVSMEWMQEAEKYSTKLPKGFPVDAIPLASQRLRHLVEVDCEFMQDVTGAHLAHLPPTVRNLNLNGCQQIDNDAIIDVCKLCPNLEELQLYWNMRITDIAVKAIASCEKIRRLNLSGCQKISDEGVSSLENLRLEMLDLTRCPLVSHRALRRGLRSSHESLETLTLYASPQIVMVPFDRFKGLKKVDLCGSMIADEELVKLGKCHELESANLTWCVNITDYGVCALAKTKLNFLSLFGLTKLTDACLDALHGLPFRALDVNGCTGITRRSKDELRKLFPDLEQFVIHT